MRLSLPVYARMPHMYIVKSSGESEIFNPEKLRGSLKRAGVPGHLIDRVTHAVSERIRNGTATKRIAALVTEQLKRESVASLYRYTLQDALLKLGPAGFKFEKYVGAIMEAYGYEVEYPPELHGACVDHEVDIVGRKDGRTVMIEAKFRNDFQYFVRLKDTMATWSRFNDLNEGAVSGKCPHFDEVWIVTNGRISTRSEKFGSCKGIRMLGWQYPKGASFASYVDHTALYPVTVLHELTSRELERLSERNLMLCRQVAGMTPKRLAKSAKLTIGRAAKIVEACKAVAAPQGEAETPHPGKFTRPSKPGSAS
jgi:hypothetical protein